MKKQYNQPAVNTVELMPQMTLCGSNHEIKQGIQPEPIIQW